MKENPKPTFYQLNLVYYKWRKLKKFLNKSQFQEVCSFINQKKSFLLLKDKTPINEREREGVKQNEGGEREVLRERCGQNLRVVILLVKSLYTGIKYNQDKTKTVFKKYSFEKKIKNT